MKYNILYLTIEDVTQCINRLCEVQDIILHI